jgi:nitrite reductase (cytochrome c-552)
MQKRWLSPLQFLVLFLVVLGGGLWAVLGQSAPLAADEPDLALWGKLYPEEYQAYIRTEKTSEFVKYSPYGRYGGSESFSKLDKYPELTRIFAGNAFSIEYREEQGHLQALNDVQATKRLGDAKPATCLTCKTSNFQRIYTTLGADKYHSMSMKEVLAQFSPKHPISCADCHDATKMNTPNKLKISRPAFTEAMARRGIDVSKASRNDMRTYVCAQCHVEYYFSTPGKTLRFPWDKGTSIDQIEAYYDELKFKDWDHAETKAPLVKIQHPEFELFSSGIHARSGVSCADCHMPTATRNGQKISDHWLRSPMSNLEATCTTCHNYDAKELRDRVLTIQDRTYNLMKRAEKAIIEAQDAIKAGIAAGVKEDLLNQARAFHRKAFIRWDFIGAENSMGFHSPQEALRVLGDSIDFARQAELVLLRAK